VRHDQIGAGHHRLDQRVIQPAAFDHVVADARHFLRDGGNGHAGVFESLEEFHRPEWLSCGQVHMHPQHREFNDLVGRVRQARGFGIEHDHPLEPG
jgi:hypothetical protein